MSKDEAISEIARTTREALPVAKAWGDNLGRFLYSVVGETAVHLGQSLSDWAKTYRYENALRLADRVTEIHQTRKLAGKTTPIPSRLAIPLLDMATLETDPILTEMWAALIANAMDPNRKTTPRKNIIHILSDLEPLDALILQEINRWSDIHPKRIALINSFDEHWRNNWPNLSRISSILNAETEELAVSLENLERLGLICDHVGEGDEIGSPSPITHESACIDLTKLGKLFLSSCSSQGVIK